MDASQVQIESLIKLRNLDREIALARRDFNELPQRAKILEKRNQISQLSQKKAQVQEMLDACEDQLTRIAQEDETLAAKEKVTQAKLDASRADYRSVESLSRDLNGIVKRRGALSEELDKTEAKLVRVKPVMDQVAAALEGLETQEARLVESFKSEGGELQQRINAATKARESFVADLGPELSRAYEEALERCGGVALSVLSEGSCSACRNSFEAGKLAQLKAEAPLATCPSCHRILLIPGM